MTSMTPRLKVSLAALAVLLLATIWMYWPSAGADPESSDAAERRKAVAALAKKNSTGALNKLVRMADDTNEAVADDAIKGIGRRKLKGSKEALLKILEESDSGAKRGQAARTLGKYKGLDYRILADVLKSDKSPKARKGAAQGLGRLRDVNSADALFEALKDDDVGVRSYAFKAFCKVTATLPVFNPHADPETQTANRAKIRRDLDRRSEAHTH